MDLCLPVTSMVVKVRSGSMRPLATLFSELSLPKNVRFRPVADAQTTIKKSRFGGFLFVD